MFLVAGVPIDGRLLRLQAAELFPLENDVLDDMDRAL